MSTATWVDASVFFAAAVDDRRAVEGFAPDGCEVCQVDGVRVVLEGGRYQEGWELRSSARREGKRFPAHCAVWRGELGRVARLTFMKVGVTCSCVTCS